MDIIDRIEDIFNQMPSEMADKLPWNGLPPRFYLKKKDSTIYTLQGIDPTFTFYHN